MSRTTVPRAAGLAAASLLGGLIVLGGVAVTGDLGGGTTTVVRTSPVPTPAAPVASSDRLAVSEIYARAKDSPQSTRTAPAPATPYGIFKTTAFELTRSYRERHRLAACSLVLYPFESPLRADNFALPKICRGAARIAQRGGRLALGDLSAERDWTWAEDVARAFVAAALAPEPSDALIGSGKLHKVSEVVELAFREVGLDWREHVDIDPSFVRAAEPVLMTPDVEETERAIGWRAQTPFEEIVRRMVHSARV